MKSWAMEMDLSPTHGEGFARALAQMTKVPARFRRMVKMNKAGCAVTPDPAVRTGLGHGRAT